MYTISDKHYRVPSEFIFRPREPGRVRDALFLCLWLCFWAVGEVLALFFLGEGIWALLTGRPAAGADEPLRMAPALGAGAFLLVWLAIWTVGGVMAIQEFFRLVWAEDRLALDRDVLRCTRLRGPFTSSCALARREIRRVFVQPTNTTLMVQIKSNLMKLTDLGTPAERTEAARQLCAAIELSEENASVEPAALPDDWQEAAGPRGERLLVPNLKTRRQQAVVIAIITGVVWTGLVLLARESLSEPTLWVVTLMLTMMGVWLARQTLWLFRDRKEWRIEPGRLVHQRRCAGAVTELCEARALELTESRDSDNDAWYHLHAINLAPSPFTHAGQTPDKIRIMHSIHDPTESRCLGRWLSQQAGIPFHDCVPTEADKQAEFARIKDQLARSGKFGRFVSRLLDRAGRARKVCVLLMAGALAGGCARDYILPPAKVQLPGYQAESLYSEGLCVVSERGELRRGYMDLDGRIVIAPEFFAAGPFNGGLAPVLRAAWDRFGYIDRQGRTVIEPRFDAALPFAGELAPVRVDGQWGFIDRQGREVVQPRFDLAFAFAGGRARVVVTGLAGFIDESGNWVVEPQYYRAGEYREGLAMVCDGRRCGFIDRAGKPVIAMVYDDAGSFSQGLAAVRKGASWGYIDRTGRMAIPPAFDQAGPFADGLARVSRHGRFDGFIDREGRETIKTRVSGAAPFSEGRTVVSVPAHGFSSDATDNRIIDTWGKFLPGRFNGVSAFREGRAVVSSIIGQKSYVIDRDGRPLIELALNIPGDYERFVRHNPNARFGYIDPEGRTVIDHAWLAAQPFSEGLAFVESPYQNRQRTRGYVDASGQLALSVPDDIASTLPFTDGLALVARQEQGLLRYGYMDRAGKVCIGFDYADAAPFREGLAAVKLSGDLDAQDWGYIATNGAVAIPPRFYRAGSFGSGLAYVEVVTRDRYILPAIINRAGAVVVEKPFLFEWSHTLFGVPSLDQFHRREKGVFDDVLIPRHNGGVRGYVEAQDRLVIPGGRFQTMGVFREGRAPVAIGGLFGYIDTAGELVIEARFAAAHPFSEGLAAVRDEAGRTGYIMRDGAWAVEPLWLEEAHPFTAGRARVKLNGHYGFLGATGSFAVPPRYLSAGDFHEGLAAVALPTRPKVESSRNKAGGIWVVSTRASNYFGQPTVERVALQPCVNGDVAPSGSEFIRCQGQGDAPDGDVVVANESHRSPLFVRSVRAARSRNSDRLWNSVGCWSMRRSPSPESVMDVFIFIPPEDYFSWRCHSWRSRRTGLNPSLQGEAVPVSLSLAADAEAGTPPAGSGSEFRGYGLSGAPNACHG